MSTLLSDGYVSTIFMACLLQDGEDLSACVKAEGITCTVGFHPGRLKEHEPAIIDLLAECPDEFKSWGGGGWSFLNLCNDRHGHQWTDYHLTMEQLVQLGLGIGKVTYMLPRKDWDCFPGGMPYLGIQEDRPER